MGGNTDIKKKDDENDEVTVDKTTPLTLRQVVCVIVLGGTNLLHGMVSGWTAILPKLQEDPRFSVSEDDVSWLVSLMYIMGFVSSPLAGPLAEYFGPRRVILLIMIPVSFFWLLLAYTPFLWGVYIGRALLSACATTVLTVVHPLVAEMCPPRIRGMASTLPETFSCVGLLFSYLLASQLPWQTATAVSAAPFLPVALLVILVPESPYWLVRKNRIEDAERSLELLLGREGSVTKDLEAIRSTSTLKQSEVKNQLREMRKLANFLPVLLLLSVFVLREVGGKGPVFNYTVYLFRRAGVEVDAFYCTVMVGVARLITTMISGLALERVGRRPLLLATAVICAVSEGVAGAFLYLEVQGATWVPLVAVLVFVGGYGIGLGPVPWVYLGELLPTPVRSLGASVITFCYSMTYFVINLMFLKAIASFGIGLTFLIFGSANLLIAGVVRFFIPETQGRTLQELEGAFTSKRDPQKEGTTLG